MRQRAFRHAAELAKSWACQLSRPAVAVLLVTAFLTSSCSKKADPPPAAPSSQPTHVRVASLVPAVTDLMLGMGLGSHLVAVSNYCKANPETGDLPAVGDYLTTDWERLAAVKPNVLVLFVSRQQLPEGLTQRAGELGITIENLPIETLNDIRHAMTRLGELTNEPKTAADARRRFEERLAEVKATSRSGKPVPTLLAFGEGSGGVGLVGRGTFLDELLTLAGGSNSAGELGKYPTVDPEKLSTLTFEKVLVLLPGARGVNEASARQAWVARGVSAEKVVVLRDWYLLLPGWHVADTAEAFAKALHSTPETGEGKP